MSLDKPLSIPFFPTVSPPPPPPPAPPPPPPPLTIENRISPSVLLIIVILAVIFFISGLLHLLVRYLTRPINRESEDMDNVTALQGQLRQLFHLHDAGVDQSYIDTLPIFMYKAIIGLKDPFDCAVCLCEFEEDDKLRLLPECSHAFHIECIDTWLLSHSTCPLCRRSLLPEFSPCCSPMVLVLESGSERSMEVFSERGELGEDDEDGEVGGESGGKEEVAGEKVVPVKLGKFRSVETNGGGEGEGSSDGGKNLDQRRCFSMGSYEYVMDESSLLQVVIKPGKKKKLSIRKPGHRAAMSECDWHCSKREGFKGFGSSRSLGYNEGVCSSKIQRKESFSISRIWLRQKKEIPVSSDECSRRAFSFRLPLSRGANGEPKTKSEGDDWERTGSELGAVDLEAGSGNNAAVTRSEEAPSFARRTLLWLAGRQNNKVMSHG